MFYILNDISVDCVNQHKLDKNFWILKIEAGKQNMKYKVVTVYH